MAGERQSVDLPDQRVIVENHRHLVPRYQHQIRRNRQRQIQQMRIRHNVIRAVSPNPRCDLQVF
jgi:hypothetical protein